MSMMFYAQCAVFSVLYDSTGTYATMPRSILLLPYYSRTLRFCQSVLLIFKLQATVLLHYEHIALLSL
jgi:hypothetical protein